MIGRDAIGSRIEEIYRGESRRVLATLIRLLGDFDLAEEGVQDAFAAAAAQWPDSGVPANPRAWLVSTGRFKSIDRLRRRARIDRALADLVLQLENHDPHEDGSVEPEVEDDRLRLIFTCCHPALSPDARVAMTLREVCGLTTEEIARTFLTSTPTVAQRIVRAKSKIRDEQIPYEVPAQADLGARLDVVLRVVYLVFNEGYSPSSGEAITRPELIEEAVRLGRILAEVATRPGDTGTLEPHAAARRETPGANHAIRRVGPPRRPGSPALGPGPGRRGGHPARECLGIGRGRHIHAPGGHRQGTHRGTNGRRNRLEADSRSLRRASAGRPIPDRRTEPRCGVGDA